MQHHPNGCAPDPEAATRTVGPPTIGEAIAAAFAEAKRNGMSTRTRTTYRQLLRPLFEDQRPVSAFADVCAEMAERFGNPKSTEMMRSALNVVAKWLIWHGHAEPLPMKSRPVRCGRPAPHAWPENDTAPLAGHARGWLAHMAASNYSPKTIQTYRTSLARVVAGIENPDGLTASVLTARMVELSAGLAASTRRTYTAAVSQFCSFLGERGILAENPTQRLPKPRVRRIAHRYLTEEQAAAVFAACRDDETRMAVRILLGTGLRAGELLALRWDDVDAQAGEITVRAGKGGKSRTVPAEQETIDLLAGYPRTGDELFPRLSYTALARRIGHLGKRACIPWKLGMHDFRRTFASHFIMRDGDPAMLAAILGHAKVDMSLYYARSVVQRTAVRKGREMGIGHALIDAPVRGRPAPEPDTLDAAILAALRRPETRTRIIAAVLRALATQEAADATA